MSLPDPTDSAQPEWMPIRPDEYFEERGIDVLRGREVVSLDAESRTIVFADAETLAYDAALVATGGVALRPPIPGIDLRNVFTLRTFDDADAIIASLDGATRAVVVGASFIGMEAAASLVARGLAVTVVADATATYEREGPDGTRYPADLLHRTALASLHGEFAKVRRTAEVLAEGS